MKALFSIGLLVALAGVESVGHAQTKSNATTKPIVETSCKDYLEMDETIKPKFIYYSVGYSKSGKPLTSTFDVVSVDKIKPVVDEYCHLHLKESAYNKIMEESMASEKANK
jgi:acid stress chaperone HdeA